MARRLRILVVGAGSIGTRHIRNLLSLDLEISAYRYRSSQAQDLRTEFGISVHDSLNEALDDSPDGVVICNRTDQHIETALAAASRGLHLYIEKPLSHTLTNVRELQELVRSKSLVVEIGCMLRFHPNLLTIRDLISNGMVGDVYYARAWVGQYLPEWRPGADYRECYSSKSDQGGGVLLDLVHELDYLSWWFGPTVQVSATASHVSNLETDTEDVAQLQMRFASGILAQVHLDCVRPFFDRGCEIVGSQGVLAWDYPRGTVTLRCRGDEQPRIFKQSDDFDRNAMLLAHMKHFLGRIRTGGAAAVDLEDGVRALKLALAARRSAVEQRAVHPETVLESTPEGH